MTAVQQWWFGNNTNYINPCLSAIGLLDHVVDTPSEVTLNTAIRGNTFPAGSTSGNYLKVWGGNSTGPGPGPDTWHILPNFDWTAAQAGVVNTIYDARNGGGSYDLQVTFDIQNITGPDGCKAFTVLTNGVILTDEGHGDVYLPGGAHGRLLPTTSVGGEPWRIASFVIRKVGGTLTGAFVESF